MDNYRADVLAKKSFPKIVVVMTKIRYLTVARHVVSQHLGGPL